MTKTAREAVALTARQSRFVDEYLIDLNAKQAAIRAGFAPSTADKQAPLWVGKNRDSCPANRRHIWDAVNTARLERSERTKVAADDVIAQLVRMGFSDVRKLFTASGQLKSIHDLDDDTAAAIQSIEVVTKYLPTQEGEEPEVEYVHKVKLADKKGPLELIGKHLAMWTEKHEHSGTIKTTAPVINITRE